MLRKLFAVVLLCLVLTPTYVYAQTTAIKAGRIVDPETGTNSVSQIILIEKGKITAIGPSVSIPAGVAVIDLTNLTVLPGLFDAHTHLCMTVQKQRDNGRYFYTTLNDPDSFRSIEGVVNARAMLESGFTTVRDVGNEGNYACTSLRRAIQQGMIPGPTVINAGRMIALWRPVYLQPDKQNLAEPEYFFAARAMRWSRPCGKIFTMGLGVI